MTNNEAMGYVIKSMEDLNMSPESIRDVLFALQDNFDFYTEQQMQNEYDKKIGKYCNYKLLNESNEEILYISLIWRCRQTNKKT